MLVAALAYLVFVIYGSLVPLDFRAVEISKALERFRQISFLDLGIGSRADWVANLLLFIPLSYLFAAGVPLRRRGALVVLTVIIAIGCAALSIAIEFTQIFFPPRTVSQNDIIAETLGGVLGLAAWWAWGERSVEWLASWQDARGAVHLAEKLLWLYLLVLFGYNLLPLDLTISLVEIYHKWSEGRLNLIPFAATPLEPIRLLYEVVIDAALWVPISLLLVISGRASVRGAVVWTLAAAALLEVLQLLVYSRYSDVTDLITALPGAFLGVWLAARLPTQATPLRSSVAVQGGRVWLIIAAIVGWCLVLAAVFWYPFNFSSDTELVRSGIDAFFQVPFVSYYFGSELRAITEVFHKVGFFMPLGVLLAWLRWALGYRGRLRASEVILLLALLGPPVVVELGQVALVNKHPGSTDLVLEWLGSVVGYVGSIMLARRWGEQVAQEPISDKSSGVRLHAPTVSAQQAGHEYEHSSYAQLRAAYAPYIRTRETKPDHFFDRALGDVSRYWGRYLLALILATVALLLVTSTNLAPYNLRELADRFPPPFGALGLLVGALVAFTPAAWVGRMLSESGRASSFVVLVLCGHVLVLYLVLRVALPLESIDDILGSVRPSALAELERFFRFAGFFLFVGTAVAGGAAAWFALRSSRPRRIWRWLLVGFVGFLIGYFVIVEVASTDNLVELIRGRGSLVGMAAIYSWLWITSFHSVLGVVCLRHKLSVLTCLVVTLIFIPVAYALFWMALEPHVEKYQQVFSAMQFLLSPDRENYAFGLDLLIRYVLMQFGLLSLMVLAFFPALHDVRSPTGSVAVDQKLELQ